MESEIKLARAGGITSGWESPGLVSELLGGVVESGMGCCTGKLSDAAGGTLDGGAGGCSGMMATAVEGGSSCPD